MHLPSSIAWRPMATAALAGGLVVAGVYYTASHASLGPLSESAPAAAPVAAGPGAVVPGHQGLPGAAAAPAPAMPGPQPGLGGPVLGSVTAITPTPPSFTILTSTGQQVTYRVMATTVFTAGRDRPYNFGLLKVGDEVRLRGGQRQLAAGTPAAGQTGAQQSVQRRRSGLTDQASGEPVARFVVVRPAGERRPVMPGQVQPDGSGASDGANG
jgi:hypothetical protein